MKEKEWQWEGYVEDCWQVWEYKGPFQYAVVKRMRVTGVGCWGSWMWSFNGSGWQECTSAEEGKQLAYQVFLKQLLP